MKAEILSQIKAAEAEAQRMIDEAQTKKQTTIEDAKKKSIQIIDAAEQEAGKIAEDLNARADVEMAGVTQKIHAAGEAEILEIKERAERKHAEALTFLLEEFKRTHYA